jgi:hypothetical protein
VAHFSVEKPAQFSMETNSVTAYAAKRRQQQTGYAAIISGLRYSRRRSIA